MAIFSAVDTSRFTKQKARNILHNWNEYKVLLAASNNVLVKKRMECSFKPDANARFDFLRETKFLVLFPQSINEFNVESLIFLQFNTDLTFRECVF